MVEKGCMFQSSVATGQLPAIYPRVPHSREKELGSGLFYRCGGDCPHAGEEYIGKESE